MYIDVHSLRINVQAEIDERVATFREVGRVRLLYGFFDRRGFHRAMIYEKEKSRLLDVVVGITRPAGSLETPLLITDLEVYQLIGNGTSVNLADAINSTSVCRSRYAHSRFPMLFARERDPCAMYGIPTYHFKDFCVLLTGRAKSFSTRGHIIKKVLNLSRYQN